MSLGKAILYVVLGLLVLIAISVVVSVIFAAIAFLWILIQVLAFLIAVGIVGYVSYKLYRLLSGLFATGEELEAESTADVTANPGPVDSVEELKRRYANGDLSDGEFERRLERELTDRSFDDIDRELQRERV